MGVLVVSGVCIMSAVVIELARFRANRLDGSESFAASMEVATTEPAVASSDDAAKFCFWRGASGDRYVHHIFSLIECPELPASNYVLVGTDDNGRRKVLHVGRTTNSTASLNLAETRLRGARLGATEVHVHLLAETDVQRRLIDMDLHTGLFAVTEGQSLSA